MSHRTGMLTVLAICVAGFAGWSMQPASLSGQDRPRNSSRILVTQTPAMDIQRTGAIPAPPPGRGKGKFDFDVPNQNEEKIHNALVNPQGVDIEFIDTPLRDAMEFLADAHRITIIIDEQALTEEGINIDEPISRILSGIKLESALRIMLEPMGLTHIIEDEVLKVTTQEQAGQKLVTRIYNTGYLQQIGVEPEALRRTVRNVIEPNEWRTDFPHAQANITEPQKGKPAAQAHRGNNAIEVLGDTLAVSAPRGVHEKIRQLLIQIDRRWEQQQTKN